MKKIINYLLIIPTTAVLSIFGYRTFISEPDQDSHVIQQHIYSTILGESRDLLIHLPRNYDKQKKYSVLYVLDGSSQDYHWANKIEILSDAGYTPQQIVVGIPNMSAENREKNLTPPFLRRDNDNIDSPMGEGDSFLKFMETELVPFIDSTYSTSAYRLLAGNSRGGLVTLYSLIYRPELFQARFCFSTPIWRQDKILVSTVTRWLSERDTLKTFLYLSAGQEETESIKSGLQSLTDSINLSTPSGFNYYAEFTQNANHQNNAFISASHAIALWDDHSKAQLSKFQDDLITPSQLHNPRLERKLDNKIF